MWILDKLILFELYWLEMDMWLIDIKSISMPAKTLFKLKEDSKTKGKERLSSLRRQNTDDKIIKTQNAIPYRH